jgi:aminoglycoside phosphotransferase family enzyme/predicted kinase
MEKMTTPDPKYTLIHALLDGARYPHPAENIQLLETHISWVLLAGDFAYKIKKPVDLGFLDFTALSAREFYCREEIRLNRRLAPQLYLEVVSIGGSLQQPEFGMQPALEYAVKMHRFPLDYQLDHLLAAGKLTGLHIDRLAATLAEFYAGLPAAPPDSGYGTVAAIIAPAEQNFQQLAGLLPSGDLDRLDVLQAANQGHYAQCLEQFAARRQAGFVRECHGDLHLSNIVLLDEKPVAFDCLEFDPKLRWIDVMNDIAFMMMDLDYHGRADLAFRFLNAYLQVSGDFAGLGLLKFYLAYRALVMAKVSAMPGAKATSASAMSVCRGYLQLADAYLAAPRPVLIITHGLPGCGKTTFSQVLLEQTQAIRLRSDIERKRLFGLAANADSKGLIYNAAATESTYAKLLQLAEQALGFGFPVIVDAAFLNYAQRRQFRALAEKMQLPFIIVSIQSDLSLLRQRIEQRQEQGMDASEADLSVANKLQAVQEPLQADELRCVVEIINDRSAVEQLLKQPVWRRLLEVIRLGADCW